MDEAEESLLNAWELTEISSTFAGPALGTKKEVQQYRNKNSTSLTGICWWCLYLQTERTAACTGRTLPPDEMEKFSFPTYELIPHYRNDWECLGFNWQREETVKNQQMQLWEWNKHQQLTRKCLKNPFCTSNMPWFWDSSAWIFHTFRIPQWLSHDTQCPDFRTTSFQFVLSVTEFSSLFCFAAMTRAEPLLIPNTSIKNDNSFFSLIFHIAYD